MGTLWLLRHAEAAGKPPGGTDHDRPLTAGGMSDAGELGAWLAGRGARPDEVLCSTALRARDTLAGLSLAAPEPPVFEGALYLASAAALLECLGERPDPEAGVLLVAHNPGIADLAEWLVRHEQRRALAAGFPPGALTWLQWRGRLAPGHAEVAHHVVPERFRTADP